MPQETTSERLARKFPLAQSGAKFGKLCLVGRRKSLHSRSKPRTRSKLVGRTSSLLPAKRLRSYARASGSFKPATLAERLRGVGNSSGNNTSNSGGAVLVTRSGRRLQNDQRERIQGRDGQPRRARWHCAQNQIGNLE